MKSFVSGFKNYGGGFGVPQFFCCSVEIKFLELCTC